VRLADILGLSLSALAQQKLRTLLTTLGVVFGTFVLVLSVSIGQGVQETITRESRRHDRLRTIDVWPAWSARADDAPPEAREVKGDMKEERRGRLRQRLVADSTRDRSKPAVPLDRARLDALAALPHVEAVVPDAQVYGWLLLDGKSTPGVGIGAPTESEGVRKRLIAGSPLGSADEHAALVSEYLLYRWGLHDDADLDRVVGRTLRVEVRTFHEKPGLRLQVVRPGNPTLTHDEEESLSRLTKRLPAALSKLDNLAPQERDLLRPLLSPQSEPEPPAEVTAALDLTIKGVVRLPTDEERQTDWWRMSPDTDVILPQKTAEDLFVSGQGRAGGSFPHALVTVDREENVKEAAGAIQGTGLEARAAVEFIERERFQYLMIFCGMSIVAAVALLVASLGIINTMLMTVLERTREIGVMKAVGARDRHIQAIFLVEGALIGLVGGGLGVLLGWAVSFPGDAWLRSMVSREMKIELHGSIFAFPPWLTLGCLAFACAVTTAAAVYPARRAARINPVVALRTE
jgi:putative ABC transport system permease protein